MGTGKLRGLLVAVLLCAALGASAAPAQALDKLCDPANEDCRAILISLIRAERVRIDVGFWFMEDARYTNELINRFKAGVPVRVLMDPRANPTYPVNRTRLAELQAAGIQWLLVARGLDAGGRNGRSAWDRPA